MSDAPIGPGYWQASDGKWYPPQAAPAPIQQRAFSDPTASWIMVGGCAAVVIGAFLPWVEITLFGATLSKAGTSGDGVITLALCGTAGGLSIALLRGTAKTGFAIAALVLSALALATGGYDTVDISRLSTNSLASASVGIGLWLTDAGAIVAIVGSILWLQRRSRTATRY